jgi:hypothetical protein
MPRAVEVQLADKTFANKSAAEAFFKQLLSSGQPISDADYPVVLALFRKYLPSYDITGVAIEWNTETGAPHYAYRVTYRREDGQLCREFKSYHKAFNGWNPKEEIVAQLRKAVVPHTTAYKKANYRPRGKNFCQCCHKALTSKDVQVDHYPVLFCDIVKGFMDEYALSYETITADAKGQNIAPTILNDFSAYHNARAHYRLTCQECNVRSFHDPNYMGRKSH